LKDAYSDREQFWSITAYRIQYATDSSERGQKMKRENAIQEPRICGVSVTAENIILLTVQQGAVVGGVQIPYEAQPGESLEADLRFPDVVYIVKDGERIGVKVEDKQLGTKRFPFEQIVGKELDVEAADDPETYRVNGVRPVRVYRKTKPNNIADPHNQYTLRHCIYLVSAEPFYPGMDIEITTKPGIFAQERISARFDANTLMSEAIHVNQLGYRRDDPSKKAYLSQWMGLGGGVSYDGIKAFYLLNEKNERVFQGVPQLNHTGEIIPIGKDEISSLCPVYEMDFSDFTEEGTFRVMIPELGCSFPFPIDNEKTWAFGFRASMNALYCQRSGIVTRKPYSEFERPRCYHPDDGKVVYQSNCSLFESGNGLNCYGTDVNNFDNLVRKGTDQVVENA
jgi:endoglucanase